MMDKIVFITSASRSSGRGHITRVKRFVAEIRKHRDCIIYLDEISSDVDSTNIKIKKLDAFRPASLIKEMSLTKKDIIWFDIPDSKYTLIKSFCGYQVPLFSINMFEKKNCERYEDIAIYPSFEKYTKKYVGLNKTTLQLAGSEFIYIPADFYIEEKVSNKNVVVTMGGTDPMLFTPLVLESISRLTGNCLIFKVILPRGIDRETLKEKYRMNRSIEFYNFGEINFSEELKNSSYAIINGGMTRYECIASKTYFIALSIHLQQFSLTEKVTKFNLGKNFGVFCNKKIHRLVNELKDLCESNAPINEVIQDGAPRLKKENAIFIYETVVSEIERRI